MTDKRISAKDFGKDFDLGQRLCPSILIATIKQVFACKIKWLATWLFNRMTFAAASICFDSLTMFLFNSLKQYHYICNNSNKCSSLIKVRVIRTVWKVSKYGVFSGAYFPVFSPNTGKYRIKKTPYLDTFHAVLG